MLARVAALEPAIKWSGSKRGVAPLLGSLFPAAERYFEPFVGGGALLPFRPAASAVAGDIIPELIALWTEIRDDAERTAKEYEARWNRLQRDGYEAFYVIRDDFNRTRCPHDLLFLTRTCVNGLIRFNARGDFNNSLHHTRPGIAPHRLQPVLLEWSRVIQGVEFVTRDYRESLAVVQKHDMVFLDPPYGGTKGRYTQDKFELGSFLAELDRLNSIGVRWVLTFDGKAGSRKYETTIPSTLYRAHVYLPTGNSPFTKLMRTGIDRVSESVYLNFDPPAGVWNQLEQFRDQKLRRGDRLDVQQRSLFS